MKLRIKHLFQTSILLLSLITICNAKDIWDIIQPVRVQFGIMDTILVSDLFYTKEYKLTFNDNDKLIVSYNSKTNTVIFQPKNNLIGAALIDFTLQGKKYTLPVIIQNGTASQQLHTFMYKPQGKISKVIVSGSFNNWNKDKDQLFDTRGNGVYELTIPRAGQLCL